MTETAQLPKPQLSNPIHLLAFGFGSGLAPWAPGTFGTLVGVALYLPLMLLGLYEYIIVLMVATLAGVWICHRTAADLQVHDHPGIVWDEMVGYWLSMLLAPPGWVWILIGFLLFRLFDIWKPWPISWLDARVRGGFGVMLDDLLAAVYTMVMMQVLYLFIG